MPTPPSQPTQQGTPRPPSATTSWSAELVIDVAANTVHFGAQVWHLKHHKAAVFLQRLCLAHEAGRAVTWAEWQQAWSHWNEAHGGKRAATPDRTATRRVLQSVNDLFAQWPKAQRPHIEVAARRQTVGPWLLQCPPASPWHAARSPHVASPSPTLNLPPAAHAQPRLSLCPIDAHTLATHLMLADALLQRASTYGECPPHLAHLLPVAGHWPETLGPDAGALVAMRWLKAMRRLGRVRDCHATLRQVTTLLPSLSPLWRRFVAAQLAFAQVRHDFEDQPHHTAMTLDVASLQHTSDDAPSAQAWMEYCNVRALTLRRHLSRTDIDEATRHVWVDETLHYAQAAYFWACATQDPWWQQACAINHAYLLERLWANGWRDTLEASLQWFSLGNAWVDKFDLPQDSAWDFVMFATLYRRAAATHPQVLHERSTSWPASANPTQLRFYEQTLQLARSHGTVREQIQALDLLCWFLRHDWPQADASPAPQRMEAQNTPQPPAPATDALALAEHQQRLQQALRERQALCEGHPVVLSDLLRDGFVAA